MSRVEAAIERVFNKANLLGDCDLYALIYGSKTLQKLDDNQIEDIYDYLSKRLGY